MSLMLAALFDQNVPHTFDKIVEKQIITINALIAGTLSPNVKVTAEIKRPGELETCHPKKFEKGVP